VYTVFSDVSRGTAKVFLKNFNKDIWVGVGKTFLDALRECGIYVRADCGGIGECGKCRIVIERGLVSPLTEAEKRFLNDDEVGKGVRLACQVKVVGGDYIVWIPFESLLQRYRSADVGFEREVVLKPVVKKVFVVVKPASLEDVRADLERVLDEASKYEYFSAIDVDLHVIKKLPSVLRNGGWSATLVLWNSKLLDVEPGDTRRKLYGIAVDIGTSKIVIHLVDLNTGETLAIESMQNPQASYGADIISRITYAMKSSENLIKLQQLAVKAINTLIERATSRSGVDKREVYEVVVVGNTAMHHLFLGIDPRYLALSPYVPAVRRGVYVYAKDLGIEISDRGVVYALPVVAGYVGSDALADAIAVALDEYKEPCMLIDIGTNSEILLNTGSEILACSTPAGPAFEGASIAFGMRAVVGAIDQVFIYFDKSIGDYNVRYTVVGSVKPMGICGSALIDIVAHLYRLEVIDSRGKFREGVTSRRLISKNGKKEFVIAWASETAINKDITINGKDINEFILAKTAIATGISILLKHAGLTVEDIGKIYIAGSFGTYINVENAMKVGLLPKTSPGKYIFVGNTAISGAKMALKSTEIRKRFEELVKKIKYLELAAHPLFKQEFMQNLKLPSQN
jgi:uncharacterized 2Fe-2S/4Fe-4S cluster protein (DUF4445 family)